MLVNIPRDKYTRAGPYIETTDVEYQKYMASVERSKFVQTLRQQKILVDVKAELACRSLQGAGEHEGADVVATWLFNFQGLESPVVIFLPGDPSPDPGVAPLAREPREIPAPGLRTTTASASEEETGNQPLSMAPAVKTQPTSGVSVATPAEGNRRKEEGKKGKPPPEALELERRGEGGGGGGGGGGECPHSLTPLQWTKADIARYSDWDKTNIMVAGSRCLSLLILVVP